MPITTRKSRNVRRGLLHQTIRSHVFRICAFQLLTIAVGSVSTGDAGASEGASVEQPTAEQSQFFEKRIRPLLAKRCHECHSASAKSLKGGLRLDSRAAALEGGDSGPAVLPGMPDESELIRAVRYDPDGYQMPPDGKLTDRQIADLSRWVAMGAPWPSADSSRSGTSSSDDDLMARASHWSFQPIIPQMPPRVQDENWATNPIDNFVLKKLEAQGLEPSAAADRGTWLRRVYFDSIGLPPTPDETGAFLADSSPDARERVIDRLLASPHHGERWARHWLDLVRYAETAGNEFDYEIRFAWRYRDYVIRALNLDLPYDQFVREHVSGDLLPEPRRNPVTGLNESIQGSGFFWLGQAMQSPIDVLEEQHETMENQIDVMCKTFLGLTVSCARCHDHKFDPISMKDYYALVGYLRSSRRQYAFIDDESGTSSVIHQLQLLNAANRGLLEEQTRQRLRLNLARIASTLLTKAEEIKASRGSAIAMNIGKLTSKDDPSDLLYPWSVLSAAKTVEEFSRLRQGLLQRWQLRRAQNVGGEAVDFEDFSQVSWHEGQPSNTSRIIQGWQSTGHAFDVSSSHDLEVFVAGGRWPRIKRLVPAGFAFSGPVSGKLRGVLRSATFTIKKKFIDYRMYRTSGSPAIPKIDPGDLKDGQVHLIIDGLHLIRHPIYHGLTVKVGDGIAPKWYRQDVSKWIGHRAYIEITDEDNGFIAVDHIQFNDGDLPESEPNRWLVEIVSDPAVTSRQQLAQRYQLLFSETLDQWADGTINGLPESEDRVEILNWLLEHGDDYFSDSQSEAPFSEQPCDNVPDDNGRSPEILVSYLDRRKQLEKQLFEPRRALAMADGTGEDAPVLIRGNHQRPGDLVGRRFLEVFGDRTTKNSTGSGRLRLAERFVDASNPLLARVMVNRVWQHHFGRGIVPTPDDFGAMGQPPSHPELLDYLAIQFARGYWSLKRLHRMILSSSSYSMSSSINPAAESIDPSNRLLHRMRVRRLEGEAIRDAILAISGRLDRQMQGPAVLPHLTRYMEGRGRPDKSGPLDGDGRRSVYIGVRRNFLTPMFVVFDYPIAQTTVGLRSRSNVPAQALTMLNNPFVLQQSALWAKRVLDARASTTTIGTSESDVASLIRSLYESAFARQPSESELAAALDFVMDQHDNGNKSDESDVWADFCHVLLNSREFIFVR